MKGKWIGLGLVWLLVLGLMRPIVAPFGSAYDSAEARFGSLPVLEGGRVKPLDSVARATLLILRGKQSVATAEGRVEASAWFTDLLLNPAAAAELEVFRIDHPRILSMMGMDAGTRKYFSYGELRPWLGHIQQQARLVNAEAGQRDPYERAILSLFNNLVLYQQYSFSLVPDGHGGSVEGFYAGIVGGGAGGPMARRLVEGLGQTPLHLLYTQGDWYTLGAALEAGVEPAQGEMLVTLGRLADMRRAGEAAAFGETVEQLLAQQDALQHSELGAELYYNRAGIFVVAMSLYVLMGLSVLVAWQFQIGWLLRTTVWILGLSFLLHSYGLGMRVYITGYAPVTNLYSSAVFTGWVAVGLSLVMEIIQRKGIGVLAAATIGFLTLVVAHHLADSGDTMEKMRAVLNSNFWLATHVITIIMGYGATFLAGFLGIIYIFYGWFSRKMDTELSKSFHRMLYGAVAFALLFNFVGTVLGGIWADQSWGRFWGWDPKENGALMIVLWTTLILHALRGGMIRTRGLVHLCIVGNIITAWSWFGTNMLGVGLHSYGFMDSAFFWLLMFWLSQLAIMGLEGLFPVRIVKRGDA